MKLRFSPKSVFIHRRVPYSNVLLLRLTIHIFIFLSSFAHFSHYNVTRSLTKPNETCWKWCFRMLYILCILCKAFFFILSLGMKAEKKFHCFSDCETHRKGILHTEDFGEFLLAFFFYFSINIMSTFSPFESLVLRRMSNNLDV